MFVQISRIKIQLDQHQFQLSRRMEIRKQGEIKQYTKKGIYEIPESVLFICSATV